MAFLALPGNGSMDGIGVSELSPTFVKILRQITFVEGPICLHTSAHVPSMTTLTQSRMAT